MFNDGNLIFGSLASNSLKDLKFVWEKRTDTELSIFTSAFFDLNLSADEEQWLCDNFNTLAKALAPAESAASADAGPAPTPREQSKKTDAANKTPAAKVDTAGTESDDLELRDVGSRLGCVSGARGHRGLARGRGRGTGSRMKTRAVRLQPHEVRRQAPRLVTTGTTGQLAVPLEDPLDRLAKRIMIMCKDGKVVSVAIAP